MRKIVVDTIIVSIVITVYTIYKKIEKNKGR